MCLKMSLIFLAALFLLSCFGQTESACSYSEIECRTGGQCISLTDVCRSRRQCSDGSDEDPEICSFWAYDDDYCSSYEFYCAIGHRDNCLYPGDFCNRPDCAGQKDFRICELVRKGKLELEPEVTTVAPAPREYNEELVALLQKAVNISSSQSTYACPMLYVSVGDACLSFFSMAKIPWAEARQFCLSIKGDLLNISDMVNFEKLLDYMRRAELTTDYWIGGRYDLDTNAWSWVNDDSPMPLGSPYWATRYNTTTCIPRSPPHTNPFLPPSSALPGAPCYKYIQAPAKRSQGWCAAMTYEHYYYFTDEECQGNRSPLCLFLKKPQDQNPGNTTQ